MLLNAFRSFCSMSRAQNLLKQHEVVLFMKGIPELPTCGHSAFAVELMKYYGRAIVQVKGYKAVDVSEDEALKDEIKQIGGWHTFPQLWVRGQLMGGSDILLELHNSK
jgi:monothiol glutaredoxin